jgi:hypothetical protein
MGCALRWARAHVVVGSVLRGASAGFAYLFVCFTRFAPGGPPRRFFDFIRAQEALHALELRGSSFRSLLVEPVQRVMRYPMLLKVATPRVPCEYPVSTPVSTLSTLQVPREYPMSARE